MSRNVIRDGYTKHGFVAPIEGIHEGLEFEYRPALYEKYESVRRVAESKNAVRLWAALIQDHLKSWSEVEEDGAPVKVTLDNILRLPTLLQQALTHIIIGLVPSDRKPDVVPDEDDYAASLSTEEEDLKN